MKYLITILIFLGLIITPVWAEHLDNIQWDGKIIGDNCYLTMRPALYAGRIGANTKPTPVEYGSFAGYSCPISTGSDGEELFFRDYVPGRWDGKSDIVVRVRCALATAETSNEDFRFILS